MSVSLIMCGKTITLFRRRMESSSVKVILKSKGFLFFEIFSEV